MLPKLGIIAGNGLLPFKIASIYIKYHGECCIASINKDNDLKLIERFSPQSINIGRVGEIIKYFNQCRVKNIVFAGAIIRPNLRSLEVDLVGSILLAKILKQQFLGDDQVLKIIASFFEKKGFKVVSAQDILDLPPKSGASHTLYSCQLPSPSDQIDLKLGIKILAQLGLFDVGQAVVVESGYVLGIEAAEGTDNLISRCASLRKKPRGGVLVKMIKQGQDARLDIPVIGPQTISNLANFGYNGLALQRDRVIIIDPELTFALANQHQLFIAEI